MLLAFNIAVLLLVGIYCSYRWRRLGFAWISPASLAAFIWSGIWTIHLVNIFGFFEVSVFTIFLTLIAVIALATGEMLGLSLRQNSLALTIRTPRLLKLLRINAWITFVFAISAIVSIGLLFGNPLDEAIGGQIKMLRVASGVEVFAGSPLFALLQYVNIARAFIYLALFTLPVVWFLSPAVAFRLGAIVLVSGILTDIAWASRTLILDLILYVFVFIGLTAVVRQKNVKGRKKRLLTRSVVIVLVFSVLFVGANKITESTRLDRTASIGGVQIPYALQQLLVYFSASVVLFDRTIDQNDPPTYGLASSAGVLNVLHMTRLYRNENLIVYTVLRDWEQDSERFGTGTDQTEGNTYSWLRYFYSDFGVFGIAMLPFMLGLVSGRAARAFVASSGKSLVACGLLVASFYVAFWSPIFFWIRPDYVVFALILLWLIARQTRKRTYHRLSSQVDQ